MNSENCAVNNGNDHKDPVNSNCDKTMPSLTYRSLLPHEPLPDDDRGYIHLQGGFEPKKQQTNQDNEADDKDNQELAESIIFYWTERTDLEDALYQGFSTTIVSETNHNDKMIPPHGDELESVAVLEDAASPPYTKVRLCYKTPQAALHVVQACRSGKISPHDLLFSSHSKNDNDNHPTQFTTRPLQLTLLTTSPLLSTEVAWNRSNPPKFRRLICRPGESVELLQEERKSTRFVFVSGLVDPTTTNNNTDATIESSWWGNPRDVCEAIRREANRYDSSGLGVEVFVSNKKNNKAAHFCHVGMRSPEDARALITGLQGKTLQWKHDFGHGRNDNNADDNKEATNSGGIDYFIQSDKLFLDYAAVTKRSTAKAAAKENGESTVLFKGEPSRSECTSTTNDVTVPGLLLVPDFVSPQEEEVLMAAINGPTAPWAPSQLNFSKSGSVKRRVQHYGYVFDYETADVLRDRSEPGADCPPLPGLPELLEAAISCNNPGAASMMEAYFQQCVSEGRGWDALACITERTRQREFVVEDESSDESKSAIKRFPTLNQITINVYEPGEGIGSHVDTPSAFGDGLISLSLNGGVVMEFRKQDANKKTKKLAYLPPRSLLVMSGPARYEWEHMIVTRMTDTHNGTVIPRSLRVSLTFRTAIDLSGDPLPSVTTRSFPPIWGNVRDLPSSDFQKDALVTPSVEREHVHAVYDAIATQWHHTRGKRGVLWPGASQFLTDLPPGSIVADCGCGDGKYFPAIWEAGSYVIGTDISLPLLQKAAYHGDVEGSQRSFPEPESRKVSEHRHHLRKLPAVAVADCMNLPFRDKSCDAAICIAVMHHLSTRERRIRCIEELGRIVKVGGLINIQAWAMEQEDDSKRKFAGTDVFVPFNAQPKYLEKLESKNISNGGAQPDVGDSADGTQSAPSTAEVYAETYSNAAFDEKKGLVVFNRYCHLYRKGELEELVSGVESVTLHESGYESGNHFVILKVVQ